jgi:hypothetical protein
MCLGESKSEEEMLTSKFYSFLHNIASATV